MISKIVSGYQNNFPVITVRQAGPFDSSGWPGLSWIHYNLCVHTHTHTPFSLFIMPFFPGSHRSFTHTHVEIQFNPSVQSNYFSTFAFSATLRSAIQQATLIERNKKRKSWCHGGISGLCCEYVERQTLFRCKLSFQMLTCSSHGASILD